MTIGEQPNRKVRRAAEARAKQTGNKKNELQQQSKSAKSQSATVPTSEEIKTLVTLFNQGRKTEAALLARKMTVSYPHHGFGWKALGTVCQSLGWTSESLACLQKAVILLPGDAEAHFNLGVTLKELGRWPEAEARYRQALALNPDYAEAYSNLGCTLYDLGRMAEAEACYRRALELKPDFVGALCNLGATLRDLGQLEEAETSYRQVLKIQPDYVSAQSNLVFTLSYSACHHPAYHLEEARRYGEMVAKMVRSRFSVWYCAPRPKRLRVGVVSGDLHLHPVGFFLESVLAQIDPSRIELIAYSISNKTDALTARIKPSFSAWKSLVGKSDEAAANLIHGDGIHLLLDLSGHMSLNRLPVFAWKPAPVQASWMGFLATTGVEEIDYVLGDPVATAAEDDRNFSEKVWRLPEIYCCFTPPDVEVDVGPLPALTTGRITFGCFNHLSKMTDAVVALWARVLKAVPDSRLFLKTRQLNDLSVRETTVKRFAAQGIASGQLSLEGASPRAELLAAYQRVDIALDPFPYNGGTTTMESLWMAVPVLTLSGDRFLSRCTQSCVFNAGLSDWIAADGDDYVARAVTHAADLDRLAALRRCLRQQVLVSPLFDAPRFARHFEAALWGMWETREGADSAEA